MPSAYAFEFCCELIKDTSPYLLHRPFLLPQNPSTFQRMRMFLSYEEYTSTDPVELIILAIHGGVTALGAAASAGAARAAALLSRARRRMRKLWRWRPARRNGKAALLLPPAKDVVGSEEEKDSGDATASLLPTADPAASDGALERTGPKREPPTSAADGGGGRPASAGDHQGGRRLRLCGTFHPSLRRTRSGSGRRLPGDAPDADAGGGEAPDGRAAAAAAGDEGERPPSVVRRRRINSREAGPSSGRPGTPLIQRCIRPRSRGDARPRSRGRDGEGGLDLPLLLPPVDEHRQEQEAGAATQGAAGSDGEPAFEVTVVTCAAPDGGPISDAAEGAAAGWGPTLDKWWPAVTATTSGGGASGGEDAAKEAAGKGKAATSTLSISVSSTASGSSEKQPSRPPLKSKRLALVAPKMDPDDDGDSPAPDEAANGGGEAHAVARLRALHEWTEEDDVRAREAQEEETTRIKRGRAVSDDRQAHELVPDGQTQTEYRWFQTPHISSFSPIYPGWCRAGVPRLGHPSLGECSGGCDRAAAVATLACSMLPAD